MDYYGYNFVRETDLAHHGIKGQRWGVRRYQNEDGTRTEAGKKRYSENYNEQQRKRDEKLYGPKAVERINKRMLDGESIQSARHNEVVRKGRIEKTKNTARSVAKIAVPVAATVAVAAVMKKYGSDSALNAIDTDDVINLGRNIVNALI